MKVNRPGITGRAPIVGVLCSALVVAALAGCGASGESGGGSAAGSGSGSGGGDGGGDIKVAAIQMLTGSSGFYGRALLKGNQLAVEQINADGGLLGRKVQLLSADNASDNAQTVNLVRKYGQDKSIAALIGPTYQPNMEAGCAIANSLGIAQIAGQSAPPPAKVNPRSFCFINSADIVKQVQETIDFVAKDQKATRFAQIYDQQNSYQTQFDKVGTEYIKKQGMQSVLDAGVNTGVTDYSPLITKMLQAKAEVVIPNLTTEDAGRFMQQARARGLKAVFVGPNASLVNARLYTLSHGAADGLIVSTNQSETESEYSAFVQAFSKKFGKIEDPISGFGYDSMMILAKAIKQAGSTDRTKIREALASIQDACASICYKSDGKSDYITTKLFYLRLTKDGFAPAT